MPLRRRNCPLALLPLLLVLALCAALPSHAAQYVVTIRAQRTVLLADGKQATDIVASVLSTNGSQVNTPVLVQFNTTAGTLRQFQVQAYAGVARTQLTSGTVSAIAHVTATVQGSVSQILDIQFTTDPEATFAGNNYMLVSGPGYLAYNATDRVIEAQGKNGSARLNFRNMEITADRMQIQCNNNIIRAANNIIIKRGKHVVNAIRLYYSLDSGQGYAVAEDRGQLKPVMLAGDGLVMSPSPTPIPNSYLHFPELSVKLIVVARGITYFPGERLQFRRPKFFQDQTQILSLPYYEMALNSEELFSDHFVSVGTNGLGLELPFYYNLSPRTSGIAILRHQQQIGRSYFSQQPGWGVDLVQGYTNTGSNHTEGAYGFTGLLQNNWGFRWNHNQEFGTSTQGGLYLDFPQHNSVQASTNWTNQNKGFRWGTNLSAGQTFTGSNITTLRSDLYAETNPHSFGLAKGLLYVFGTRFGSGRINSRDDLTQSVSDTTQEVTFRTFTRPISLDRRTTLNNSVTLGQAWGTKNAAGATGLATLALDHTLTGGSAINLTYDFISQPSGLGLSRGKHRMSLTYNVAANKTFQLSLFGTAYMDAADSTFLADAAYRLTRDWRLLFSATLQQFQGASYRDLEFSVGRRLGAREIQLTYSTLRKRISIDLTATRF